MDCLFSTEKLATHPIRRWYCFTAFLFFSSGTVTLFLCSANHFHVVAPDYPGFGNSDLPSPDEFNYTFDRLSQVVQDFLKAIGFTHFGLYMQDYGGPVGFGIITRHPEWLEWLIIQTQMHMRLALPVHGMACVTRFG